MRHSPKYSVTDEAVVRRVIAEHPWTTFVSTTSAGLAASHYPALLDETADGSLAIVTHLGRPDDQIHELTSGAEILAIVQGPHGYVSPSWYTPGTLPVATWNFSVAHLYGTPQILSDAENIEVLTRLTAHFERRVERPQYLPADVAARVAPGTVGLRLPIDRFVCKVKSSQDKDAESQQNVIDALRGNGAYAQPALAADMQRALAEGLGGDPRPKR